MDGNVRPEALDEGRRVRWRERRWFLGAVCLGVVVCVGFGIVGEYVLRRAEPILRARIVASLSERFDAPVELDRLQISLPKGIEVEGTGLRIPFSAGIVGWAPSYPMIAVRSFAFRMSFRGLLLQPMHVDHVHVDGMEVHIPPSARRRQVLGTFAGRRWVDPGNSKLEPKGAILVDVLSFRDLKLFLESGRTDRDPLLFAISALELRDVGRGRGMLYEAELTNPKPYGFIHTAGRFGPWAGGPLVGDAAADPGQTPLDGKYTFNHAELNTIRGLGGTLSSAGRFSGVLDRIAVEGTTDTPDFSLDIANRPVPLHTVFRAVVNGTNGDTYLNEVRGRLQGSEFVTSGKIVKLKGQGHDIQMAVEIPHGRVQDFLRLAVRTQPPVVNGVLTMRAKLHIPPGHERVPMKMEMAGSFEITQARLSNARWQEQMDRLSARAQGRPQEVAVLGRDGTAEIRSQLAADFTLSRGVISATKVRYEMPGAQALMNGVYSMDGRLFEFKGLVRTEATASQMVSGWKSWLLKPVDSYLKKNGAGVELPIEISGTEGDLQLGLAMHGTDETPQALLSEVRAKDRAKKEMNGARREAALASADDAAAARAPTLEAAEQAHNAAVRHRAEALQRALASERVPNSPPR